jgi:molecular chaperone DnaJ
MTDRSESGPGDDLYAALGIPAGATADEITRAYRRLAREHHPDSNPEADSDAFAGLTDAYDVLHDPERRRAYDDTRRHRARAARAAAGMRIPVRHVGPREHDDECGPPPAAPAEIELALSFEQAALGTTVVMPLRAQATCPDCGGTGTERRTADPCSACAGGGSTTRSSAGITIRHRCPVCDGTGKRPPATCDRCHGDGRATVTREVTVRVPPGVTAGTRLRVRVPDVPGLEAVAVVSVAPHPYFDRRGDDLTVRLPVTLAEAALGAVVTVPTLAGAVAIRIPPGTPPGRRMRVRGHGIPRTGRSGDLLVTVDVVVPGKLDDAQRRALEAFAAATPSPRAHFEAPPPPSAEAAG